MPIVNGFAVLEWLRGNMPEIRPRCTAHRSWRRTERKQARSGRWRICRKSAAVSVTEFVRNWDADGSGALGVPW